MGKFKVLTMLIENDKVRVCRMRRTGEFRLRWYYNVSTDSLARVKRIGHGYTEYDHDWLKRTSADDAIEVPLDNALRGRNVLFNK